MTVLFFPPHLTLAPPSSAATAFFRACSEHIRSYMVEVETPDRCVASELPHSIGAVLFFTRTDQEYNSDFLVCLRVAERQGARFFPIGMTSAHRKPPVEAGDAITWSVEERLRQAGLQSAQAATVAALLGRKVVASVRPTLIMDYLTVFISYKCGDGAQARVLAERLKARRHKCFFDETDLDGGDRWHQKVEKWLEHCHAFILLETPNVWASEAVRWELKAALAKNIPIVWVRIQPATSQIEVDWLPGATKPHVNLTSRATTARLWSSKTVDEVVETAYALAAPSDRILDDLKRFHALAERYGIHHERINDKELVYAVKVPHPDPFRYWRQPMTHLVQFYGRQPKAEDVQWLAHLAKCYAPTRYPNFDATLALGPMPAQAGNLLALQPAAIDSSSDYLHTVLRCVNPPPTVDSRKLRGVILSGSFADNDSVYQRQLTKAIQTISRAILERSGILIFGGHPTFQPLIEDMARRCRPKDYRKAVRLYLSRYFVHSEAKWNEYRTWATVYPIDAVEDDRALSLTAMRSAMIRDKKATALIVLGGKSPTPGYASGVDEEVQLALACGMPVFLIGAPGGRAAELADLFPKRNQLSAAENHDLLVSPNFGYLADLILHHLKF